MGRVRDVDPRLVVTAAAVAAALLRFPGLLYPLGSDEAGFTTRTTGAEAERFRRRIRDEAATAGRVVGRGAAELFAHLPTDR